ncbi:hypothetical protein K8W59_06725 [Nocardioides rotundus]|uniref:hypothetical protein n=1 Tax=Nocardioides rotundus TaxID=1774216 RepID=UPI001CBAE465|nr:hypothetical protein [Nocardioides rotundus]UAL31159.1 hypothetical protein K8W59_06725 [Nocardioides rotundus]
MVRSWLDDRDAVSEYDHDLVLSYARRTKHELSIGSLEEFIDKFEASKVPRT